MALTDSRRLPLETQPQMRSLRAFDRIYPELAAKYGVPLYPFFLDGVAADRTLTLPDGLHPNAAGVGVIVRGILPKAEELIARVRAQKQS